MPASVTKSGAACGPSTTASSHAVGEFRQAVAGRRGAASGSEPVWRCSTSPVRSSRPPWPPKPPRVNVDAEPSTSPTSKPPCTSTYARRPGTGAAAQREHLALAHRHRDVTVDGSAVERRAHVGAGDAHDGVGGEAQRGPDGGALEPRRAVGVAEDAVAERERAVVHRSARRHADVPQADSPGQVLHGGGAGDDHVDRAACVPVALERRRGDGAGAERGRVDELGEQAEVGLDAAHGGARAARRASRRRPRRASAPCTTILARSGS